MPKFLNIEAAKDTGLLIFTKSSGLFGRIIQDVEGPECTHVAGTYYDVSENKFMVAEMKVGGWWFWKKGGLVKTELSKWLAAHYGSIVEIAVPVGLTEESKIKLALSVKADTDKVIGYDFPGLFIFLNSKYRRLHRPELMFCSEYWSFKLKKICKIDLIPETQELIESPQDLMRKVGQTLISYKDKILVEI